MITVQPAGIEEALEIKQVLSETWIDTYGPFLPADVIQKVTALWHSPETLAAEIENPRVYFGLAKDERNAILGLVTAGRQSEDIVKRGPAVCQTRLSASGHRRQAVECVHRRFPWRTETPP